MISKPKSKTKKTTNKSTKKRRANSFIDKQKHIKDNGAYFKNDYRTGEFKSMKNQSIMIYRSSFEYAYMCKLEKDPNCLKYIAEPFKIRYVDSDGAIKNYIPDLLILWKDGSTELVEIKPKAMMKAGNVQRKAKHALSWLKNNHPETTFRFITENQIFSSNKEYQSVLKRLK